MNNDIILKQLSESNDPITLMLQDYLKKYKVLPYKVPSSYAEIDSYIKHSTGKRRDDFASIFYIIPDHGNGIKEKDFFRPGYNIFISPVPPYSLGILASYDFIEVIYVIKGAVHLYVTGLECTLEEGDFFIMSGNTPHYHENSDAKSISVSIYIRQSTFDVIFRGILEEQNILSKFFMETLHSTTSPTPYLIFKSKENPVIRNLIFNMYSEQSEDDIFTPRMLDSLMTCTFIKLLQKNRQDVIIGKNLATGHNDKIVEILYYIQTNIKNVTLGDISNVFHYSTQYISCLIHEYTGDTFTKIVNDTKMRKAALLLKEPDIPIQTIADELGYTDNSHFYRSFKKFYGITPAKYREVNKNN